MTEETLTRNSLGRRTLVGGISWGELAVIETLVGRRLILGRTLTGRIVTTTSRLQPTNSYSNYQDRNPVDY